MNFTRYPRVNDGDNGVEFNYTVNHGLSLENQAIVIAIQNQLRTFGLTDDYFWYSPATSLHTTLFDWTEAVPNERDCDDTFRCIETVYKDVLHQIVSAQRSFDVTYDQIQIHIDTIILKSSADIPQMSRIRRRFCSKVTWLEGNKQPPRTTHVTIARCKKDVVIPDLEGFVRGINVSITQSYKEFRLCKATRNSMAEFKIIETFQTAN